MVRVCPIALHYLLGNHKRATRTDTTVAISTERGDTIARRAFEGGELPEAAVDEGVRVDKVGNESGVDRAVDVNLGPALVEEGFDALVEDDEGRGAPGRTAELGIVEVPSPLPPVASSANPTDIGFWRNTEYTFFKKVSPTTQEGAVSVAVLELPSEMSKTAPTQNELPSSTGPRFMSSGLIGHAWPPKDRVTLTWVEQGN